MLAIGCATAVAYTDHASCDSHCCL